ncbi:helix-turn-helix domain-containing protein [Flavihumibacter profundi]|uniref:helix-turn-helix domain-containing protein n=1 Tax=Flavihumibacter profundi TaxID=2716883 RepID=UPI001CC4F0D9|nr:helix-turn-helix domain-containing protein [Flavihumibacter profundi]MBZ5858311.1 hypothetical protein [Flavihumibacter profundi]
MTEPNFQKELFSYIKNSLPQHISMVDEIAEMLNLSYDSVYRRIRGEKPLALHELKLLCEKFKLSVDQLLHLKTESILFDAPGMNGNSVEFINHINGILRQFTYFNSFREKEIFYLCKDSTIWNFYLFPEIAAFKTFFWTKTINNDPALSNKAFSYNEYPFKDCYEVGQKVLREFNKIPCVELWNTESMISTINQIAYYRDAGNFKTQSDFDGVLQSFHLMIDHLQHQAEKGVKFMPGDGPAAYQAPIQFYVNELILGNNTMAIKLDSNVLSMVTYSVYHYLFTRDERFANKVMSSFNSLLSRSTLISKTGEKDRNRFFNAIREKVNSLKK